MTDALVLRRKRLLFQSLRRGTRESDDVIGGFAHLHIDDLNAEQLDRFEALLEQNDPDLLSWIIGLEKVPAEFDHDVMALLQKFKNTLSSN